MKLSSGKAAGLIKETVLPSLRLGFSCSRSIEASAHCSDGCDYLLRSSFYSDITSDFRGRPRPRFALGALYRD